MTEGKKQGGLVLSRRPGENIIISLPSFDGKEIIVSLKVVETNFGSCKLQFFADSDVQIDREEIYIRKKNSRR